MEPVSYTHLDVYKRQDITPKMDGWVLFDTKKVILVEMPRNWNFGMNLDQGLYIDSILKNLGFLIRQLTFLSQSMIKYVREKIGKKEKLLVVMKKKELVAKFLLEGDFLIIGGGD